MSRRIALSAAAAIVVLGGAGAFAFAYAEDQQPALDNSDARYAAPDGDRDGSFTFTTEVTASSGVKSLKVLAWPADDTFAKDELTEKDMAEADSATCKPAGDDTARCTYKIPVTAAEAAESPRGPWHVATLTTAKDGTTTFDKKAASFTIG
ncbi:hypothetical protein I2W78_39005 [Streptomyces spinoverrucosus]|uniref:DUF5707 domain-containing protein n=1 Tax=Streptomyces spinoverrucosus TaxID=284043 RepID=UPI0018C3D27A|nr:DUF5707 domain-containing protein [Streptomyces spinoverrucosus]MBG0857681.1 hypothetical protein [Streptomyces spinoverrucosus]